MTQRQLPKFPPRWRALVIGALACWLGSESHGAGIEPLDTGFVRAYYVAPLTNQSDSARSWIALRLCASRGKDCVTDVARIPLSELKARHPLKTQTGEGSTLELRLKAPKGDTVLASLKIQDGWYQATELCGGNDPAMDCRYGVYRDEQTRSLVLRLFTKND